MRRLFAFAAVTAPALLIAGCGGSGTRVQSASVTPAVIASPVMLSSAAYVAAASSIDLYEMKSAQLALEKAQDPANRALAQQLLDAHRGTSYQLSMAGRRLNLLPSASVDPEHQQMLDALAATGDFDNTYRAQQAIVLQEAVRLHEGYARTGDSPTLRPVAANAESVMKANLQALRGSR